MATPKLVPMSFGLPEILTVAHIIFAKAHGVHEFAFNMRGSQA